MESISELSSILTLVSFMIYFIGRIIRINITKKLRYENLEVYYNSDDCPSNIKVVDEYNVGCNNSERLIISSEVPFNWIKIYEYEYDEIRGKFKKGKLIDKHGFLKAGHAIQINTYLPCGMPAYLLEFQRYDYLIGRLCIAENGKNGVLDELVQMSHTIFSYLYYIFE